MRIADVLLAPQVGGAETLEAALATRWRAEGHEVATLYLDPPAAGRGRLQRIGRLRRALEVFAPDVVHAHSALPSIYARLASRGTWPVVTVLHSAGENFNIRPIRWAERALQRWTRHVVAINSDQVEEYRSLFGTRTPITLIPNGVREDVVPRSTPASGLRVAVALSRLVPQKRIDVLLGGWARAGLPDAELRVAGDAPDETTDAQIARWASESPGSRIVGAVADVAGFLADADVLVHAADTEGHPLAPLEAAVAGIPVVVSDQVAKRVPELEVTTFRAGDPRGSRGGVAHGRRRLPAARPGRDRRGARPASEAVAGRVCRRAQARPRGRDATAPAGHRPIGLRPRSRAANRGRWTDAGRESAERMTLSGLRVAPTIGHVPDGLPPALVLLAVPFLRPNLLGEQWAIVGAGLIGLAAVLALVHPERPARAGGSPSRRAAPGRS